LALPQFFLTTECYQQAYHLHVATQISPRTKNSYNLGAKRATPAAKDPKITKKAARTTKKTALKPVATGSLLKTVDFDADHLLELPTYKPPLNLQFKASKSKATGLTELQIFQKLLIPTIIDIIVDAINSYAKNARANASGLRRSRSWKQVNSTDIWRYLGCLLYIGIHIYRKHEEHWLKDRYLTQFISLKRFQ
jgi:Transposase IS4